MSKNYMAFGTEQNRDRNLQLFTCGVSSDRQLLTALSPSDCRGRFGCWQISE